MAAVLLLQTLSDLSSLVRITLSPTRASPQPPTELPSLLFLVPAHNEELLIEPCVRSLMQLRYPTTRFRVVVIADNCTDRTAALARAAGAHCLERNDLARPGKPRAIAWALEQSATQDYDGVVVVDADTVVAADFAVALAQAAPLRAKAVQGYFDVRNRTESSLTRLATLLAAATHRIAYPLKQRAALNVPLVGNGFCIGTEVLRTHGWTAFSIAEDWEMYARLTAAGVEIEGAPKAVVYAQEARTLRQSWTQRQRWTAGKVTVLARVGPSILRGRRIGPRQKLDAIAELSAPGPVLHLGLAVALSSLAIAAGLPIGIPLLLSGSLLRPLIYNIAALRLQPDPVRTLAAFAFLPVYALWRLGAAAAAVTMLGDTRWVRTERHGDLPAGPMS
ncbi:MAG TPA: glycosyltransferase family 2 protein [Gemmatimonadales bacterium]|nr:glycosyltransferase family 2 protein [Gemmatimonadales bacterium]